MKLIIASLVLGMNTIMPINLIHEETEPIWITATRKIEDNAKDMDKTIRDEVSKTIQEVK